jgi:hypothetical protein
MSNDEAMRCANCGTLWSEGVDRCDQCNDEFEWQVVVEDSTVDVAGSKFQLSVSETLHAMAIVAVCFGAAQLSIFFSILLVALAIVSVIRTCVQIDERWQGGDPVKAGETILVFWQSFAVTTGALLVFILITSFTLTVASLFFIPVLSLPWPAAGIAIVGYLIVSHLVAIVFLIRKRGFASALFFGLWAGVAFTSAMVLVKHLRLLDSFAFESHEPLLSALPLFLAVCCTLGFACFRDGLTRAMSFYTGFSISIVVLSSLVAFTSVRFAEFVGIGIAGFALAPVLLTLALLEEHWRTSATPESYRSILNLD